MSDTTAISTKTVTVIMQLPDHLDAQHILDQMGEEFYYANKYSEDFAEYMEYISLTVQEGDSNES